MPVASADRPSFGAVPRHAKDALAANHAKAAKCRTIAEIESFPYP